MNSSRPKDTRSTYKIKHGSTYSPMKNPKMKPRRKFHQILYPKRTKFLGISKRMTYLTEVQALYTENYKA